MALFKVSRYLEETESSPKVSVTSLLEKAKKRKREVIKTASVESNKKDVKPKKKKKKKLNEPIKVEQTSPGKEVDLEKEVAPEKEVDLEEVVSTENLIEGSPDVVKKESKGLEGFQIIGDDFMDSNPKKIKRVLPHWLTNPVIINDVADTGSQLSCFDLIHKTIQDNLSEMHITKLFPVQEKVIPIILKDVMYGTGEVNFIPRDICVSAATGSGKTLAFVIPIVQALLARNHRVTQALVVLPTRELALQVYSVFLSLCKRTNIRCKLLTGAGGNNKDRNSIISKNFYGVAYAPNIVVATPGRLVDQLKSADGWSLKYLRFLVVDEADKMMVNMKQNWLKEVEKSVTSEGRTLSKDISVKSIYQFSIPLQKLLFSATLSADPEKLERLNLFLPRLFTARSSSESTNQQLAFVGKYTTPASLKEHLIVCKVEDKLLHALHLILKFDRSLCFTGNIQTTRRLSAFMQLYLENMNKLDDFKCAEFSSAMSQKERNETMKKFKNKKINCLICSDSVARGLDVVDVSQVIIYDVPSQIKTYVHRIGRTARAGREGSAYTLLIKQEVFHFKSMLRNVGKEIPKNIRPLTEDEQATYLPTYNKILPLLSTKIDDMKKRTRN